MTHPAITQEDLRRRLAVNVRTARNGAGLTLKVASERVEMHWRHWQKIEAAEVNVTLQTLIRLGEVLDIDPANLIREPAPGTAKKK
jgi:ribosome-binding protein aMBF1 (putative translation factor)